MIMTLSVPLKIDSLIQIAQWVESCLEQWLLPASKNFAIQLCCEEAFSNIVKYGVHEQTSLSMAFMNPVLASLSRRLQIFRLNTNSINCN